LDRVEYLAGQRRFQARVGELQQLGVIDNIIPSIDRGSCAAAFSSVLPAYLDEPTSDISVKVAFCTSETSRATYQAFLADDTVPMYADKLSAFDSPALLVAGENDVFGADWLERHQEILALAPTQTRLIPNAGHLAIAEQPLATLAAIAAFLSEHPGDS
jgi:pimeloyl-ACP methyl ester carboxylesterase